ncbi:jg26903 [Pararge aegeria aegeria]|uniref:Jg26903 protein n=1 Tax=Pararge aegeria aegeria TaxID=348720 RepID=A0A8S4QGC3_9NEOP|nr:jg26903 [Pararge aegeria aegeria]
MRLSPDAYEKVKKLRREVPEISPAATRIADYPREPAPPVDVCVHPPPEATGPCARKTEDVSFSCPHLEPKPPCCVPKDAI